MIPLIPALVLAFISFLASAFVILRIVIPILPPSPLSRRVSPSEFGLPAFRSLSPADKAHLWLAGFDFAALCIFVWQVINEDTSGVAGAAISSDPLSSARLWFFMTARQGCLLVVVCITLLHVRMGRSVAFGKTHWMLWAPVILLALTSTTLAGVMSGAGVNSLFQGLAAYSGSVALLTTAAFAGLFSTLYAIKRNLAALNEGQEQWPPLKEEEENGRPSFATEEIDAIRDGESWVTSVSGHGSRRNSGSAWSFSTHQTAVTSSQRGHGYGRPQRGQHNGSVPARSPYWFTTANNDELVPPVPPIPSQYGATSDTLSGDPDPFRRSLPPPGLPRERLASQTSWITESKISSRTTLTAWSFPPTYEESTHAPSIHDYQTPASRPSTPALATAQVLGGYGFGPQNSSEEALSALAIPDGAQVTVSLHPVIGWFISVWLPLALSLPYLIVLAQQGTPSTVVYVLYVLSVTLSAPLLALGVLFKSSLPMPTGLFDRQSGQAEPSKRLSTAPSELPLPYKWSHEYKRSMSSSPTVVEGRRSGDVWITNGDAVNGKSKLSRAMSMLSPKPKLSVIPPEELHKESPPLPPVPIPDEDSLPVNITHNRSHSETSAQFGRLRSKSRHSSRYSGVEESAAQATRIMIAQRHYSTLAQTVVVSPGGTTPDKRFDEVIGNTTGVVIQKSVGHLRSRSGSSISGPQTPTGSSFGNISPPPPFPLPPTPPNVRAARLAQMSHKKSFSSSYSFGPVENINEIDALTAGVLPLLVPGLTVGPDMRITDDDHSPPGTFSKSKGKKAMKNMKKLQEFGEEFTTPVAQSTTGKRQPRARKDSHKNHFSLPSLSLGKEGLQSLTNWSSDIRGALENKVGQYIAVPGNVDVGFRNTVFGGESVSNNIPHLQTVREEEYERRAAAPVKLGRAPSKRSMGIRADVPVSARSSVAMNAPAPPSASSTVTLFEEFEAELESNPRTHSTPHSTVNSKPHAPRQPAPPVPVNRRSSIVYIKSEERATTSTNGESTSGSQQSQSTMSSISQWSARAVRPLIPKTSLKKLQRKADRDSTSGKEGLRQLTLLQERDTNSIDDSNSSRDSIHSTHSNASVNSNGTRPLALGKRQKTRKMVVQAAQDENAIPEVMEEAEYNDVGAPRRGIKPLALARSETSKQRAHLRRNEVLPDVVVRPPSTTEHTPFAYSFRGEQ